MFVPLHQPEVSPRAEELARRINEVITAYRSSHPDLSGTELQQALMRAAMSTGPGGSGSGSPRAAIMAAALGLLAALGVGLMLVAREGSSAAAWPMIAIVIVAVAVAAVVFTIRRSSS